VSLVAERRLLINMRAARDIGFSPRWLDLTDAEQINADALTSQPLLMLLDALHAALMDNRAQAASRARMDSGSDDARIARSTLLPQLLNAARY